ncbi:VOC family protein [Paenibacillus hemerocallicola]|uniref:VOC family protein n=1 Tax=Paenibacillus hemerocallicola TaxID=1172614 RepID=A0A5C4SYU1_9BACL|nr:VOC family protein [Paenibacillus hemerocallicola]TNJ59521.1 VOC family protein [Paenibacillus hemerocallicola]
MPKLTPYIMSEDAKAQAAFYTQALGGEITSVMTHGQLPDASEALKDKVMHMSLVAGGIPIFMSDSVFGPVHRGNNIHLSLEFATDEEAHEAFGKLAEGGKVVHPLQTAFWGSLFGQIEDKFGVLWMVTTEEKAPG